ncbi:hypothetical protein [Streptomyces sp. HUAS TT7]|uniref:hypothetical protein n=1 Tax=Streptomyces sp. HUAS TT7 TaxID=3447507 RepID=UPI003F65536E
MKYIDPKIRANAEKSGIPHASEEIIAAWHGLAEAVSQELQHVGLPSYVEFSNLPAERRVGACVCVNTMDSPAGGVYVTWNPSKSLAETAQSFMEPDRFDLLEPLIEHSVRVGSLMDEAISSALTLAGFRTRDATELNDLASGIHVAGRQPRQWYVASILTEGVLGLIASIRACDPCDDDPSALVGISAEGKARLTGRAIRIVQDGLHGLAGDDRQELTRVVRRVAGAMHSQDMARRGFWKADRSLMELADELCLPTQEPTIEVSPSPAPTQVLAAAYLTLLGSLDLADEDTVGDGDAIRITEAWTGTLLRRLDQAPAEDRQELIRLFQEAARQETDPAYRAFAATFPKAIGLVERRA